MTKRPNARGCSSDGGPLTEAGHAGLRLSLDSPLLLHGQLQDRGALPWTQVRQQHDLAAGKFERVVVRAGIIHVHLPEARHLVRDGPLALPEEYQMKAARHALDVALETDLGAG